jgi:hypothetical protein
VNPLHPQGGRPDFSDVAAHAVIYARTGLEIFPLSPQNPYAKPAPSQHGATTDAEPSRSGGTAAPASSATASPKTSSSSTPTHATAAEFEVAVSGTTRRYVGDAWMWNRRGDAVITPLVAVT